MVWFFGVYFVICDFVDYYCMFEMLFDYGWESCWMCDEGLVGIIVKVFVEGFVVFDFVGSDVVYFVVLIVVCGIVG